MVGFIRVAARRASTGSGRTIAGAVGASVAMGCARGCVCHWSADPAGDVADAGAQVARDGGADVVRPGHSGAAADDAAVGAIRRRAESFAAGVAAGPVNPAGAGVDHSIASDAVSVDRAD